jgi:hypothetical protein
MKKLLKLTMIGAALMASSAYADVLLPSTGNGELTLFVRDVSNGTRVYARGLGITINNVLTESTAGGPFTGPVQNFTYTLPASIGPDPTLTSFLAGGSNYVWTVMAADTDTDFFTAGFERYLTTTPTNLTANPGAIPANGVISAFFASSNNMMADLNNIMPDASGSSTAVDGQWGQTGQIYSNGGDWFGAGFNNQNALGAAANLYVLANSGDDSLQISRAFQAVAGLRLLADGTLESVGGGAPVPLPAGIWLLGSALASLAGVARRRAASAV